MTKSVAGEESDEKCVESDDSAHVDEDGPHFEPIVPLPNKIDVKTGEEEEEEMFCNRAKLFHFEAETKEWKERGIGSIKILKHKTSGKYRLLMREQVLKIRANHDITGDMILKPNAGSDKSWVWFAMDYADEMPKTEQLAIHFKTADEAALFKQRFDEAQRVILKHPKMQGQLKEKESKTYTFEESSKNIDLKSLFRKKEGEWDCNVYSVISNSSSKECVACSSPNPSGDSKHESKPAEGSLAPSTGAFTFGLDRSSKGVGDDASIKAFGPQKPFSFKFGTQPSSQGDAKSQQSSNLQLASSSSSAQSFSFGHGSQVCETKATAAPESTKQSTVSVCLSGSGLDKFVKKAGQWDCDTCLVRNEAAATNCVSCSAPCSSKKKEAKWDCDACLVRNEGTSNHCVSCQKPNPNADCTKAAPAPSSFRFSIANQANHPVTEEFKQKFEECQQLLLDITLQTPHKLANSNRTANLIRKAEEMKSDLMDLKPFLTCDGMKGTNEENNVLTVDDASALIVKPISESTGPTLEWDNYDLQDDVHDVSAETSIYPSPLASSPLQKNLFRFGESSTVFSFSFQPIRSPSKSPAKLKLSGTVGTDDEQEINQEEKRDGQYFEPVLPLPDVVELLNGEENEQVVFRHRAKLYRYDKDFSQWKERGIGDIKILQNYETWCTRLVMRRDQVLKLCANHWITSDMKLEPMKGAEKAWIWSAYDFAEGEGKVEQLAVRFKLLETANSFKDLFEKAKDAQEKKTLLVSPLSRSPGSSKQMVASPEGQASGSPTTAESKTITSFKVPERVSAKSQDDIRNADDSADSDLEIVFEQQPTKKQAELARKLMLPPTFFTYKNKPGYVSDESDGEDYETAVRNLKGKLYPDSSTPGPGGDGDLKMELSNPSNPVVFFTVTADDEPLGKITIELFANIVPKTAENFRALCTGEKEFGYRNSIFHRIIPDFMCQGGDITKQDGSGGKCIYGDKFEDENFEVHHMEPGILSMANRGRDTNNSQFFIILKKTEHLDSKHVAFGVVRDGMDVVKQMGELGSRKGKPSKKITVVDCGQL